MSKLERTCAREAMCKRGRVQERPICVREADLSERGQSVRERPCAREADLCKKGRV